MTSLPRSARAQILVVALWSVAQPSALASDQDSIADPEIIQELLDTVGRLTRSSRGRCPYLGLRVRPQYVSDVDEAGYVLVVFDVSTIGRATNAEVVASNLDASRQAEALELVALFRFRPVVREGEVLVYKNWVERIDFLPEGSDPDSGWPEARSYMDARCR